MLVRAKFKVESITIYDAPWRETGPKQMHTIKLHPVQAKSDPLSENAKFWDATPTGSIEIGCANPEAAARFEVGREYYVDFTRAE